MSSPTTAPTITSSQEFTDVPITTIKDDDDAAATVDDASNSPSRTKEMAPNKVVRQSKNFWRRAIGCCKKSTPRTKIKMKEHQIAKRKKAFGMEYIDLVRNQAGEDQLQSALDSCLQDVGALMNEIEQLQDRIQEVSVETKSKLKPKPAVTFVDTTKNDGIYPTGGGLYTGGDPKLVNTTPRSSSPSPAGAFTITDDDDEKDSAPSPGPVPKQVSSAPSSPMPASAPPVPPAEDDGFGSASSSPISTPYL